MWTGIAICWNYSQTSDWESILLFVLGKRFARFEYNIRFCAYKYNTIVTLTKLQKTDFCLKALAFVQLSYRKADGDVSRYGAFNLSFQTRKLDAQYLLRLGIYNNEDFQHIILYNSRRLLRRKMLYTFWRFTRYGKTLYALRSKRVSRDAYDQFIRTFVRMNLPYVSRHVVPNFCSNEFNRT